MVENNDLQGFFDSMLAPGDAAPSHDDQATMPSPVDDGATEPTIADEAVAEASMPAAVTGAATQPAAAMVSTAAPRPSSSTRPSALVGLGGQRSEPPGGIPVQVPAPMPEEPNPNAEPPREWVVFNLGSQTYALDVNLVREIVRQEGRYTIRTTAGEADTYAGVVLAVPRIWPFTDGSSVSGFR